MSGPPLAPPLEEIIAASGISHPNGRPYTHITATCVVWQDAERVGRLLSHLRPHFARIVVGVQESTDDTLAVVSSIADTIVTDSHRGFGDATYGPRVLSMVTTPWALKIDADEWPDEELLACLSNMTWHMEKTGLDGMWIPFRSWVEDLEWEEQHSHLRLFRSHLGWPAALHSTPPARRTEVWRVGHIEHRRSLYEMLSDYLSYLRIGQGNAGHTAHNELMLRGACIGTAAVKGWDFVMAYPRWDEVKAVFKGEEPWSLSQPDTRTTPATPSPRSRSSTSKPRP